MKTLYIIRHADSNQMHFGADIKRPLTNKGLNDALTQAKWLSEKITDKPLFVSSPALRTQQTLGAFLNQFGLQAKDAAIVETLYHAQPETYYNLIEALPKQLDSIAIISHNPGLTYLANELNCGFAVNNFPPCAVLAVTLNEWNDIRFGKKNFLCFKEV